MKVIHAREIDASLVQRWAAVQASRRVFASPYFSPQFTQAVAQVRDDAFVLVDDSEESPLFFPFQRGSLGRGRPIGGALNDCQGIVSANDDFDLRDVLRFAGLNAFEFDHVVADLKAFTPWHQHHDVSPRMKLSAGYEAYLADRKAAGTDLISQILRKRRKLERELGPLRFEFNDLNSAAFEKLREWKSAQYIASGLTDVLSFPWTVQLLDHIRQISTPDFAGLLSTLYAGEQLLAVHLGMRSRTVWHYWFPAYNVAQAAYSPGLILLLLMAEHAPALGLEIIDLGKGDERYKQQLMNDSLALAEGRAERPGVIAAARQLRASGEQWIRQSPFFRIARIPGRVLRKLETRARFR